MSIEKIIITLIIGILQGLAATVIVFKQLENRTKNEKIIFFIFLFLYCVISFLFIPNQFRFILSILTIIFILYFILKIKDILGILYAFNTFVILTISEIIITVSLVLFGISSIDIVNNIVYNLLANVLDSILAITIINFKPINNLVNKLITIFRKNKNYVYYLYIILIILYLILNKNGLELILKQNYFINIGVLLLIILIMIVIVKNISKNDILNETNKQMLNYVSKYEKIITDQGKANHEFKNQLMVIRGYAQMKDNDKLLDYIDTIISDTKKTQSSYLISQLNKFPDGGIKGLLYYKLSIMEENKIRYEIDVESGIKTKLNSLSVNMYNNITKILGVLLDNAIDASIKGKTKEIIISVTKEKTKVVFSISNTYKGKINESKIGTGYTTKGKGHGYGLKLVNDIIKENSKLSIINSVTDKYYISELSVNIQNKKKK